MTTIITRIEGDQWVATTPHLPELQQMECRAGTESEAVALLIAAVRKHIRSHEQRNEPVPWIASPTLTVSADAIVRGLTGLWPEQIRDQTAKAAKTAKTAKTAKPASAAMGRD